MSLYGNMGAVSASNIICDLRSDTLTQPSAGMREAMANAVVGDDVYGEDPSVLALEQRMAEMLGKDAGVFFPTGTQSNLAAVMAHCGRGDEVIVGAGYHICADEAAGVSVLAGVALQPVALADDGGLDADAIRAAIKVDDPHYARSRLLCLENTVGGQVVSLERIDAGVAVARDAGLATHLDGARYFNAVHDLGCDVARLAQPFDTVSVCLSKGLGCPVGSMLVGPDHMMHQIRRNRKILGGSMRQTGVLAAAGLYALDHHLPELPADHERAARLGRALQEAGLGEVRQQTNMVFLTPEPGQSAALVQHMAERGIKLGGQVPSMRLVVHRDIDDDILDLTIRAFQEFSA